MKYKFNKVQIETFVKECFSIAEVCRKLEIKPSGGNYKTLKNKFNEWEIDYSHFTGQGWHKGEKFKPFNKKYKLEDVLIVNSPYKTTYHLKERLYKEHLKEKKCEICNIINWNNKEVIFELDHINGINNDNRLENLRILCPNCHSQTVTFRNRKRL
jgi:ribosomal protein S27E